MTDFLERYFVGTYFHFLEKENSGRVELHWYFAYSTILMIAAYNFMFIFMAALSLNIQLPDKYVSAWFFSGCVATLLVLCWVFFLMGGRYRQQVPRWTRHRKSIKKMAMRINWSLLGLFFAMAIYQVIKLTFD